MDVTALTGKIGLWHNLILFFIAFGQVFFSFNNVGSLYTMPNLNHWCMKPANVTWMNDSQWMQVAIPKTEDGKYEQCNMYQVEIDYQAQAIRPVNAVVTCQYGIDFDDSVFHSTVVQDYEIACDKQWQSPFPQSMSLAGVMIGCFIFGHVGDYYGRRVAFYIGVALLLVSVLLATFANSFWFYVAARGLQGLAMSSQYIVEVIFVEVVFSRSRFLYGMAHGTGFSIGEIVLAGLSLILPSWRILQGLMLILFLTSLAFFWIIIESPRWYLTKKNYDKGYENIKKIASWSNTDNETIDKVFPEIKERYEKLVVSSEKTILDLFKTKQFTIYTLCISFHAFVAGSLYYATAMAMTSLGGIPHFDAMSIAVVEFASSVCSFFVLRYIPRRVALMLIPSSIAVCYFVLAVFWRGIYAVNLAMTMAIKAFVILYFLTGTLYSDEVYPTPIRAVGFNCFEFVYRFAAAVEPFIMAGLLSIHKMAPPLFYGSLGVVSMIISFLFLPETLNRKLKDSSHEETTFDEPRRMSKSGLDNTVSVLNEKVIK